MNLAHLVPPTAVQTTSSRWPGITGDTCVTISTRLGGTAAREFWLPCAASDAFEGENSASSQNSSRRIIHLIWEHLGVEFTS